MRSGREAQLAVVAELVAVDAGELLDDGVAAGGDALVEVGDRSAVLASFGGQRERDVFDLLALLGPLFAFQLGGCIGADRVFDPRHHVAFLERRVAEVVRAGDLLGIENSQHPLAAAEAPQVRRGRLSSDDLLRRRRPDRRSRR